eukprot:CAMPEP_0184648936 /NCGR_PEP_ID=MMETSP0308-20130426/6186_1 /TAXON_ID=38269 /ORGANISM="Gloeochaete witrockiana, Strain SAG 46.84" /LENGTH=174 /DNA_ID=CAMNT_0027081247 /DNA_START=1047 /DNA_END=1570 /DNA_ORIENTATION=-
MVPTAGAPDVSFVYWYGGGTMRHRVREVGAGNPGGGGINDPWRGLWAYFESVHEGKMMTVKGREGFGHTPWRKKAIMNRREVQMVPRAPFVHCSGGAIDVAQSQDTDYATQSQGTDDAAESQGTDDVMAQSRVKDDVAQSRGMDDVAQSRGKDDVAQSRGTDDVALSWGKDDLA